MAGVTPAQAATYASTYSELSLPAKADLNNQVVLSGRIWRATAGRAVSLYTGVAPDGSGGSWLTTANTDANGRFSFVTSVYSATRFKFFSAKQLNGKDTYAAEATAPFVVSPPDVVTVASSFSEVSAPGRTDIVGVVTLSGRVWPAAAGRTVSLLDGVAADGSGGTWKAGTHTDGNGRFSFVTSVSGTTRFRFFSANQQNGNYLYANTTTGALTVTSDIPSSISGPAGNETWGSPIYTSPVTGEGVITGTIIPAVAGRQVNLYEKDGAFVGSTTTNASGVFGFTVSPTAVTQYRVFSAKHTYGTATHLQVGYGQDGDAPPNQELKAIVVRKMLMFDDFSYATKADLMNSRWAIRQGTYQLPGGTNNPRTQNRGDWSAVELGSDAGATNVLRLGIKTEQVDGTTKFMSGHLGTSLPFVYGHIEARVRFQRPGNSQSSVWYQSYYDEPGDHEFDVFESMGDGWRRNASHPFGAVDHNAFTNYPTRSKLWEGKSDASNEAWWDEYHVVRGTWTGSGYSVTVDGGPAVSTGDFSGSRPGDLILSMLVTDGQADALRGAGKTTDAALANHVLSIDWVRVWR
ncbi:hypothetical protein [Corallococcus sp. 4LFB]|uniref:hypothetical protein n=1 Tax=Corallococcus sp. 4LFB TaxID=3383249 RepID=UPI0039747D9C